MPLATGTTLQNRYRIVKLIAQGGFGAIYKAWDLSLKKHWALKENLDSSPSALKQFEREAQILASLSHPNLPGVTDHFTLPGQGQYLVMDYVEGEDLQEMLDRTAGPLPEAQVLPWIHQVCDALSYLHAQTPPVIHRDIKPANIRVTPQGKAMLVDFGISKIYTPGMKTTVGARAVTPGYSPYEQYGHGVTDARTDVYALGATAYTLLTGRVPPESIDRMRQDPLAPARDLNPLLSASTSDAIARAMQVFPEDRYQTVSSFQSTLVLPKVVVAQVPTTAPVTVSAALATPAQFPDEQPFPMQGCAPALITAAIVIALMLIIVFLVSLWKPY
jgi:eukaryotic-like serine/threonine-protein kinase